MRLWDSKDRNIVHAHVVAVWNTLRKGRRACNVVTSNAPGYNFGVTADEPFSCSGSHSDVAMGGRS